MKPTKYLTGLLVFACLSSIASAAVTVIINGAKYDYTNNPRLETVLSPVALKDAWYWPESRLYRINQNKTEQRRTAVLSLIAQAIADRQADSQIHSALTKLARYIEQWQLAQPIPIQIDYDLARLVGSKNPRFEQGDYVLNLFTRSNKLHISGLVNSETKIASPTEQCSGKYFSTISKLDVAHNDFVFVVQPDGNINKLGIAYWNLECQGIMPGSQIIVPIRKELFSSTLKRLNRQVAELATYRVIK